MTDKKENNSFGKRIKKALDAKLIAIIILVVYNIGEGFYITYQEGAKNEKFELFKADAKTLIDKEIKSPSLLIDILGSDFVNDFAQAKQKEIESVIVNGILSDDSTKIDFVTMLGKDSGLRNEIVKEKFKEMFSQYVNGDLLTVEEAKKLMRVRRIAEEF